MGDRIKYLEDSSKKLSEDQKDKILEILEDIIPDILKDEDFQDKEKEIQDELQLEYKKGCFKVEFGNITSIKPSGEYYYHFRCECCEDGETIDLSIEYTP